MSRLRLVLLCAAVLCAFAANSLLARSALGDHEAGAASYTAIRLISGAAVLWLLARGRLTAAGEAGWRSALALFAYAAPFSWAYLRLPAGTGALLLFGAVQTTMIGAGIAQGERPPTAVWLGLGIAAAGLVGLTLPGLRAPSPIGSAAMLAAGVAWGWYSLRGRGARDGLAVTRDAFLGAAPFAAVLWIGGALLQPEMARLTARGAALALASGALTSGLGYTLWNMALPQLTATTASVLQLSVPALAAAGGALLLGESINARVVIAGSAILGGVAIAVFKPGRRPPSSPAPRASAPAAAAIPHAREGR
jgi:drug/metabolite transporter (DMT)-like permease